MALTITMLCAMGGLGVDVGRAYTERRLDQNAVDAAVMSASVEAITGGGVMQDVVTEIDAKIEETLGRSVTSAQWTACSDSAQLHHTAKELALLPATDCISFSKAFDEVRVRMPSQTVANAFAPVVGVESFTTWAAARSQISGSTGVGAPPFVALSTATKGDFVCLRGQATEGTEPLTLMDGNGPGLPPTPGLRPDPCDSSQFPADSQNFGTLLPHAYTNNCLQREIEKEKAVSVGIDHMLGHYPAPGYTPGMAERMDGGGNCTVAFPNTIELDTGFSASGLRCALISLRNGPDQSLCNGEYPRLWQGPFVQDTYKVVNEKLDNTPLWTFLRPAADLIAEDAPLSCSNLAANINTATWDHYDKFDAMLTCFKDWQEAGAVDDDDAGDPVLFEPDLAGSARFAFIPQVYESSLSGDRVHIEGFLPVFMTRLYISSNNSAMCDPLDPRITSWLIHDAGMKVSCGSANGNIDAVSAVVFHCGMVPRTMCDKSTGLPKTAGVDVYEIQLAS